MAALSPAARARAGFTIIELLIAVGAALILGLVTLTFSSSTLTLFARNFALNESHIRARDVVERANWLLHQCVETPALINEAGAEVAAGPSAGVRVLRYASNTLYRTNSILIPTNTSIVLKALAAGQSPPRVGDCIVLQYQDTSLVTNNSGTIQAFVTTVSSSGSLTTIGFGAALSTFFSPFTSAVWTIPVNAPVSLLTNGALVAVNRSSIPELRYYPYAMSVSRDGQSAFDNTANYRPIAELQPLGAATKALPFSYADAAHRRVDMNIRAVSNKYRNRLKEYTFFESIHSSTAYRSAVQKNLQP